MGTQPLAYDVDMTTHEQFAKAVIHCVGKEVTLYHDPMFTPGADWTQGRIYPGWTEACRQEYGAASVHYVVMKHADKCVVLPIDNCHGFNLKPGQENT
jgi:hypothetical protein